MNGRINSCGSVTSRSVTSSRRCRTDSSAFISCIGGGIGSGIGGGSGGCNVINIDYVANELILSSKW